VREEQRFSKAWAPTLEKLAADHVASEIQRAAGDFAGWQLSAARSVTIITKPRRRSRRDTP
jgi:hypothetical protein